MADEANRIYEVAIVGMGPVGVTLANGLGQYGISTVIIDRQPSAYPLPRAVSLDDEAMRIFQSIGLAGPISEITEIGSDALFVDAKGETLVRWERPKTRTTNGWFPNGRFHQPELEAILRQGLKRYSCVTERWGNEAVGLTQTEDGVTLDVREAATNQIKQIHAAYVVGCDGARSFIRSAMGSEYEDLGFEEPWLVIDLLLNTPMENPAGESVHFCDPRRSGSDVFVGAKRRRFEFRLKAGDDPETIIQPESVWSLIGSRISRDDAELERATVYTFRSAIADAWRSERVFVAGDAAHLTPPFMAQGMCAGLRDAANLGWKLEHVLKRGVADDLLDSYESERRPHVREYIELTMQMGQMINRTASAIVAGNATTPADGPQKLGQLRPRLGPGLSAGETQLRGQMFPQLPMSAGVSIDDEIGPQWALILRPGIRETLTAGMQDTFSSGAFVLIDDRSPELVEWFTSHDVLAAMIRPDRYIIGTARTAAHIPALVESTQCADVRARSQ